MKTLIPPFITLLALLTSCAATEKGPDETQKAQLAEFAAHWAVAFNSRDFDTLPAYYADQLDFNGRPASGNAAVQRIRDFLSDSYELTLHFEPASWQLDSMRGKIYAGHLSGMAYYAGLEDSMETQIALWVNLPEEYAPTIVAQFDKIGATYQALKQRFHDRALAGKDFDDEGRPNYYFWSELAQDILPKTGPIRYFAKYGDRRMFYAMDPAAPETKMGIIDQTGQLILPYSYDDIGGIGVFIPDAVEVKVGTRKGIIKLDGTTILPIEQEAILPVFNDPYRNFWAYKEGTWTAYTQEGQAVIAEGGSQPQAPDWEAWLQAIPFHSDWKAGSPSFKPASMGTMIGDDETYAYPNEYGILRMPFALVEWNLFRDISQGGMEFDSHTDYTIDSIFSQPDGSVGILTTMEEWGIGGRESYHDQSVQWVIFEPQQLDTTQVLTLYRKNLLEENQCSTGGYRILGDTLFETWEGDYLLDYYSMPRYRYFSLQTSGRLKPLLPEREFPFMSLLTINSDFLKGCFYGDATDKEELQYKKEKHTKLEDYESLNRVAQHMRSSDLDYLVNEVYASHGFIFSNPKWKDYYTDKDWYQATNTNVEKLLTPTEKKNIAFVRAVQNEMAQKEAEYTKAEYRVVSMP